MTRLRTSVVIARPLAEVYDLLLDLENARHFDPEVRSVERTTDGPIGVGTTFSFVEPLPPFGRVGRSSATYSAIDPGRRIEMTVQVGPVTDTVTLVFAPSDAGTRVTVDGDISPPGWKRLLAPLLARLATRTWDSRLGYIKAWLETTSPGARQ